ncbi:Endomembrane protein 70 protein family [Hibiscus syriacus]|uniref:Transmembrane 9 superfamily member n=1 Tax=Hibiscus syriacus TaxID=106335 RepID=A0A6A2WES5_HIBSY|nr:Endomembrane protein 70 protein family [Hibiscus syriacus]
MESRSRSILKPTSMMISAILFLSVIHTYHCFYLPGIALEDFQKGDPLKLTVQKILGKCFVVTVLKILLMSLKCESLKCVLFFYRITLDAKAAKQFKEKIDDESLRSWITCPLLFQLEGNIRVLLLFISLATIPQEVETNKEIIFTYDVEYQVPSSTINDLGLRIAKLVFPNVLKMELDHFFLKVLTSAIYEESGVKWASRWDAYLLMNDDQIHWFSIVNSLMVVLFLSGMVAMIMLRTLYRDISNQQTADSVVMDLQLSVCSINFYNFMAETAANSVVVASLFAIYDPHLLPQQHQDMINCHSLCLARFREAAKNWSSEPSCKLGTNSGRNCKCFSTNQWSCEYEAKGLRARRMKNFERREASSLSIQVERREASTLLIQVERREASALPIQVERKEASALPIQVERKEVSALLIQVERKDVCLTLKEEENYAAITCGDGSRISRLAPQHCIFSSMLRSTSSRSWRSLSWFRGYCTLDATSWDEYTGVGNACGHLDNIKCTSLTFLPGVHHGICYDPGDEKAADCHSSHGNRKPACLVQHSSRVVTWWPLGCFHTCFSYLLWTHPVGFINGKIQFANLSWRTTRIGCTFTEAKEILVGGKPDAWKIPSSESDSLNKWAENSRFRIGDSLEYKDGNTKVKLDKSGPFYFISGAQGHCEQGQKLHVIVMSQKRRYTGISPAPSPAEIEGPAVAPTSDAEGFKASFLSHWRFGIGVILRCVRSFWFENR